MLADLIHPGAFGFRMKFERGDFSSFYGATPNGVDILAERRKWLAQEPARYLGVLPDAAPLLRETMQLARSHSTLPADPAPFDSETETMARVLGENWEVDYLLLKPNTTGSMQLLAGCVCFPSSWALEEKIGKTLDEVHGAVPGLNLEIGRQIATFLNRLKPGISWNRNNWGLSASPERNQHPHRQSQRLEADTTLGQIYFRVEKQSLVALPNSGGILFGIRIEVYPLKQVKAEQAARERLISALKTMPDDVARYKGLQSSRERIIELLTS